MGESCGVRWPNQQGRDAHCAPRFLPWPRLPVGSSDTWTLGSPRFPSPLAFPGQEEALPVAADCSCSPRSWASPFCPRTGIVFGGPHPPVSSGSRGSDPCLPAWAILQIRAGRGSHGLITASLPHPASVPSVPSLPTGADFSAPRTISILMAAEGQVRGGAVPPQASLPPPPWV